MPEQKSRSLPAAAYAGPDLFERVLGVIALGLLFVVLTALQRGHADWARVPLVVWPHLLTMLVALALTPVMFWRRRGDGRHRVVGYIWVVAMALTAFDSLLIRMINHGRFSLIHILSVYTLGAIVMTIVAARQHNHRRHRNAIRAMVLGALGIAGLFTLLPGRLLGHWLFG